ncbi:DUF5704 domain-containing protein [Paenibacillus sp. ACRRX]|uniref:DUF5704 domain-containing protein n=1 Tax=Paenibacillus sp. ACRRX TaxID=2918206 RepID=UPI001EF4A358|nr:DUF5704 domain-containing protein [Paenibacillus sp. ACRRX]
MGGTCEAPYPVLSEIPDEVDLSRWPATSWSYNGNVISSSAVDNVELDTVMWIYTDTYYPVGDPIVIGKKTAKITTKTGGDREKSQYDEFMKRPNGCPKMSVMYETPVNIVWKGEIYEEKEIDVNPDSTIGVGEQKQLNGSVRTKAWGSDEWGIWYDIRTRSETKWSSEDESIATVDAKGEVTGQKSGTVRIRAIWDNGTYRISDDAIIKVTQEPGLTVDSHKFCVSDGAATFQLKAHLTKADGRTYDLTSHTNLSWSSSNKSIVSIDQSGRVTSQGVEGSSTITAHFKDPTQNIDELKTSTVTVEDCDPKEDGECTYIIGAPSKRSITSEGVMVPSVTGMLRADNRGAEVFNVNQGIPTSESLFANVLGMNYLYQSKWANMTGQVTYTVTVTKVYHKTWTIPAVPSTVPGVPGIPAQPMELDVPVTKNIVIKREYNYWQIDNLEVYKLNRATVSNYALGGYGTLITLNPQGYTPPNLESDNKEAVDSHVHPQPCGKVNLGKQTVPGGATEPLTPTEDSLFKSKAEAEVKENKVNNDKVVFNGTTIMNNNLVDKTAPTPIGIPQPVMIDENVLYKDRLVISNTLVNKLNQPTTGKIYYELIPGNIKGGADKSFDINGMNTVTVHTPVVIYAKATDDKPHNQKTKPNPNRAAFILDRPFSVFMPTSGQHRNIPGYGNRDYAKYFRMKEVRFPFDVYTADRGTFYPKQTWITIPVTQERADFFLPVWVDEGDYTVEFRSTAENAPSDVTDQRNANTDLQHHRASDTIPIEVIGRLYDFKITDIADYNWSSVFRQNNGTTPKGTSYWVGKGDIDGEPRGNNNPYVLSIAPGSHPNSGYKNVAVKTGYHFKFELKSKGNMFDSKDGVRITPNFYFVDKTGTKRQAVDLYYHSNTKRFVRIGSPDDTERRYVILNDRMRNVSEQEMTDTALYIYDHYYTFGQIGHMSRTQFVQEYIRKAKEKTLVGKYNWMILPYQVRTLIGPKQIPTGVDYQRAYASVQKWYGDYSLPADVYAVSRGTNLAEYGRKNKLDEKSPIFLRNGYIVVNFNLESIRDGNVNAPHLQYIYGPLMNQWQLEGYRNSYTDPYGNRFSLSDGDIIFYHGDKSSRDDFDAQVPH